MPLAGRLYLLPLALACATLAADEPKDTKDKEPRPRACSTFGASVQVDLPLRDLGTELDHRMGFGLGLQWTHEHGPHHASRTRLEFNVFPEGNPVAGVKTYAKNVLLSFDHLFRLGEGPRGVYLVAGLGGVRWVLDQTMGPVEDRLQTTKLAVTGGVGVQLTERVALEARYVAGGIQKTFDANTVQASLGWRF
jgi:hypothetical protein